MYYWKEKIGVSLGKKLRGLRLKSGRTLKEQSDILGVCHNTVCRWERNICIPRKNVMNKIIKVYGVSLDWLLKDVEEEETKEEDETVNSSDDDITSCADSDIEQQLLKMYRKLPENSKNKVIGYVLRIYVEDMGRLSIDGNEEHG